MDGRSEQASENADARPVRRRPRRARESAGELDPGGRPRRAVEADDRMAGRRTKNNRCSSARPASARPRSSGDRPGDRRRSRPRSCADDAVVSLDLPRCSPARAFAATSRSSPRRSMRSPRKGELIVFVDEVHTVVGAGGGGEVDGRRQHPQAPPRPRRAAPDRRDDPSRSTASSGEGPALERRFQPVRVGEPSITDAVPGILHEAQARVRAASRDHLHRRGADRRGRAEQPVPHRARAARQGDRPHRPRRRAAAPAAGAIGRA